MIRAVVVALALLLVAPAAANAQADGSLVSEAGATSGEIYRVVGGAPLWLSTCSFIPESPNCEGTQPVNLSTLRQYPADNATARAYTGAPVYRFAGGAPLWISSCGYAPGCPATVIVDLHALTHLGHTRQYPVDGTVVENVDDGGKYRFAGGAPLLVRCDLGPGCSNVVRVDGNTFASLGAQPPMAPRMRQHPADGTTVQNIEDGVFYRFAGGAPLPLSGCAGCDAQPIDALTLRFAGAASGQPRMAAAPAEGTFLATGTTVYRVAGGAAIQIGDCGSLNGCRGSVSVDAGTISSLGGGRLLAVPKDGTVLRAVPSGRTWEIIGGKRRETFIPGLAAIEVDEFGVSTIPLDAPPPPPPVPEVFKPVISSGYKVFRRYTRFTSLKVREAPAGSIITVNCKGKRKGCPFKKQKYYRLKGTSLNVYARWFKKAKLRSGATVTVRVSSPTGARKQMVFKVRSRKLPVRTTRCSTPGAKLTRCTT